ncbi:MAG: FHA domain-containing protein [Ruminococcus sp.]|nr:FHA domain-containing protein [Ruminococcus sp.]
MQFHFENQGSRTYLTYDILHITQLDFSAKEMITNNNIPGMANAIFMQIDDRYCIRYDVSSMLSASQLFSGMVSKKLLIGFFRGIADAFQSIEEYMLDENMLLLDCDYIFTNVSTGKTVMICLPIEDKLHLQKQQDKMMFLKEILYHAQFDMNDDSRYIAHLMNYVNKNTSFSAESFKSVLSSIDEMVQNVKPAQQPVENPMSSQSVVSIPQNVLPPQSVTQISHAPAPPQNKPDVNIPPATSISKNPAIPKATPSGMAIPGGKKPEPEVADTYNDEGEISWLYLMQHYNKENAAKYKAQKAAKKASKSAKKSKSSKESNENIPVPSVQRASSVLPPQPVSVVPIQQISDSAATSAMSMPQQNYQQQFPVQPPVSPQVNNFPLQTTVLNPMAARGAGTTVLNPAMANAVKRAYMYRISTHENIEITSSVFKIGREASFVNYCISNNSAISGSHAYIMQKNSSYFLIDTNSTNKTYVNNSMIQSNVEVEIHSGDKIRFADEEFEFKIM